MKKIETVRVEDGKGFKTINKTDFNEEQHVLYNHLLRLAGESSSHETVVKPVVKPVVVKPVVKDDKESVKPVAKKITKQEAERIIREALNKNAEK